MGVLVIGVAALAIGWGTIAYFSDTETSSGNTFTAGAIDLKIDSSCSYNGEPQSSCTWNLTDLTDKLFANFVDLKPGDHGENTISFHVESNDAWLCAEVTKTEDDDVDCTEPEIEAEGDDCAPENDGELDDYLMIFAWADDGDNVFEPPDEKPLMEAPVKLAEYVGRFPIVDSTFNAFGEEGPLKGGKDYYIGVAWCFGDMTIQNGTITCDGGNVGNDAQTDTLKLDVSFEAVQARNNGNFKCVPQSA